MASDNTLSTFQKTMSIHAGAWQISAPQEEFHAIEPYTIGFLKSATKEAADQDPTAIEDAALFFVYLLDAYAPDPVIISVFQCFQQDFLENSDVHSVVSQLEKPRRRAVLKAFSISTIKSNSPSKSAIIQAAERGDAELFAVFGGQGSSNLTCLSELRYLYNTYGPLVVDVYESASKILRDLAGSSTARQYYQGFGFDLISWLENPDKAPPSTVLSAAPTSFPLIGLLSLAHYCITCKTIGKSPGDLRSLLAGTTGHSQGVVAAAVVAQSKTWEDFSFYTRVAMKILFWIGIESHRAAPAMALSSQAIQNAEDAGEGFPSPMLNVRGQKRRSIEAYIQQINKDLRPEESVYLALVNSSTNMVVGGPPRSLLGLCALLRAKMAADGLDQSRIVFSQRKPTIQFSFLPISAPFHGPYLEAAKLKVFQHLKDDVLDRSTLGTAFCHSTTGKDCRSESYNNMIPHLIEMIMTDLVDWPAACFPTSITHILDFGPGRPSALLRENIEGSGIRSILMAELSTSLPGFGNKSEFFSPKTMPLQSWETRFSPKMIRGETGEPEIQTKMTKLFGVPPVMVAGMTPTTVPWDFVASVINAGYHIELAAGGYVSPEAFEAAIRNISRNIPVHQGITCNLIYVNPRAVSWQIPLIRRLITEGVAVEGLTIGAGVPSVDIASEWIQTLGLKHISFKPGSVASIEQVLNIADLNPDFPIGLQWTGGRAGGHHSYEDFAEPIASMYGRIRQRSNIVLIAGSGFGDGHGITPFFTGDWSGLLGYPKMPFDGVLLGSRMMVAKEAHTSPQVKALIAQTPGCTDSDWHQSYNRPVGGVVTVSSEMGQPIHKLANRAVLLWKYLDDRVFSIKDSAKRLAMLEKIRVEVISRLNSDFAKPWFATDMEGHAGELEDMTYAECLRRLISLMYISSQKRWIHDSYRKLTVDFMVRINDRLPSDSFSGFESDFDPALALDSFLQSHELASTELLYPEDVSFFVALCKRRGQKPVNFIPRIDAEFETWFKKDSLWQMEDLDAVIDQDPQRVCVIHGPVAASHSNRTDESAGSILNGITDSLLENLQMKEVGTAQAETSNTPLDIAYPEGITVDYQNGQTFYVYPEQGDLPDIELTISHILKGDSGWAEACLTDGFVRQGSRRSPNPIRGAFRPAHGDRIIVSKTSCNTILSITLETFQESNRQAYPALHLQCSDEVNIKLKLTTAPEVQSSSPCLDLTFEYCAKDTNHRLHESLVGREESVKSFYGQLWDGKLSMPPNPLPIPSKFDGEAVTLSRDMIERFMTVIAASDPHGPRQENPRSIVPIDICIVVAWKALIRPLVSSDIQGDLLKLLHRSNAFEYYPDVEPLAIGDILNTFSNVTAVSSTPTGKSVEVTATITREGSAVVKVTANFFIQGSFNEKDKDFSVKEEPKFRLDVNSLVLDALIRSRKWLQFKEARPTLLRRSLLFELKSDRRTQFESGKSILRTWGRVFEDKSGKGVECVGTVEFSSETNAESPVVDFLQRHGHQEHGTTPLNQPGWHERTLWQIIIPQSGLSYSQVSQDTNPIHTSQVFAGFAGLPSTVTHGMYTSAAVRRIIEKDVSEADCARFREWSCSFEGMVTHGQTLDIRMKHTAMIDGRMAVKVETFISGTDDKVLEASGEIEQPPTAYLFCGQGSQEKGMGMSLYDSNDAARAVWDRGDKYLRELYGFSLIDIVRNDPKSLTVYFKGRQGRKLRQNYLDMTRKISQDGEEISVPILTGLTSKSLSYTFSEPRGLLFSTQFAQPALTLMEVAEMEALKHQGVVQQNAMFAGHSLGEYSALAACTTFMPLESLLNLVFYRGLTMQVAMTRDKDGRTDFSMVAVNPSRIHKGFSEDCFKSLIGHISSQTQLLLEIVNWNVQGQQYVCAGHLQALLLLGKACDRLADGSSSPDSFTSDSLLQVVQELIPTCSSQPPQRIQLARGLATTPLNGIDVPFHSTYLRGGIDTYRNYLKEKILLENIVPEQMVGKFIPNVTGLPFSVERGYVEKVAEITNSEPLRRMLQGCA